MWLMPVTKCWCSNFLPHACNWHLSGHGSTAALSANKASFLGDEPGESLVDAFEMFRIGSRSTFKASATDALTFWATGISYSG